jgi:aspartyl-tRNA(Asn)/glutamyl-tRNA(Gln) amidotransferase subunit A
MMNQSHSVTEIEQLADASAARIGRTLAENGGGSEALTELFLDRIAHQTSPVFVTVTAKRALADARAADARLANGRALSSLDGVPLAWKDLVDMAGTRTTAASSLFRDVELATADAPVVTNASRAGMVCLGKLNLAEFAYSALGQNPHFGTPLNPCSDVPHAPGGSSSGSGVAVGLGLAPATVGSDTAGSVRIPASFCGVVGLKTSERQVPTESCFPLSRTQDTLGPLARTVKDCALLYNVLRGAPGAAPDANLASLALVVPQGFLTDDLAPAVAQAFEASLTRLAAEGVRIRWLKIPALDAAAPMLRELGSIVAADAFFEHRALMDSSDAEKLDQRVRARIEIGRSMSASDLVALQQQRARGMAEIRAALNGAFLAMPTTPDTAPALSAFEGDDDAFKHHNLRANRNTSIASFYDLPGLAIPNGRDAAGLPTSFLLSASSGQDLALLGAGRAAEATIRHPNDNNERNWQ